MTAHPRKSLSTAERAVKYADAFKAAGYKVCAVKINGREIEVVTEEHREDVNTADLVNP